MQEAFKSPVPWAASVVLLLLIHCLLLLPLFVGVQCLVLVLLFPDGTGLDKQNFVSVKL